MTIQCMNEDGTMHDFDADSSDRIFSPLYCDFITGKIGNYDGGFDSIAQFKDYKASFELVLPVEEVSK